MPKMNNTNDIVSATSLGSMEEVGTPVTMDMMGDGWGMEIRVLPLIRQNVPPEPAGTAPPVHPEYYIFLRYRPDQSASLFRVHCVGV